MSDPVKNVFNSVKIKQDVIDISNDLMKLSNVVKDLSNNFLTNFTLFKTYIGNFHIFTCDSCGNIIQQGSSNERIISVDYLDNALGKIIGYSFMGISGETYPANFNSKNIGYISSYNNSYVYAILKASLSQYTNEAFEEWVISRDGKIIESRYTYINSNNTSELWVGKFTAIL